MRSLRHARCSHARVVALLAATLACEPSPAAGTGAPITVFAAGSLAKPIKAALDSSGVPYRLESAGSLELGRRVTELQRVPDLIALADEEVFTQLLMPVHVAWYATFATNRLVVAFTPTSTYADAIRQDNWSEILLRPGIETGRAAPDLDPAGYRTLLAFQLAERALGNPGLARQLERAAPLSNVRPKSAELVALLQTGALDYAWMYESIARAAQLRFVTPGPRVDLGSAVDSAWYASAVVRVRGASAADTVTMRGRPIRYALSIPVAATNAAGAVSAVQFLLGSSGRRIMAAQFLPPVDPVRWSGSGIPARLQTRVASPGAR